VLLKYSLTTSLSSPPTSSAWRRRRFSGSVRESAAARAATEPPPITATVVPSKVAATSAVERGGMANGVVGLVGLIVGVGLGENARRFGWLWKLRRPFWSLRTGEETETKRVSVEDTCKGFWQLIRLS
jgi:hypothetical protein